MLKGGKFWRLVKVIIKVAENLRQTIMDASWLKKLKELDGMV